MCLSGEPDLHEAEATMRLVSGLARAARRDIPVRVLLNRVRRTQLARHAAREAAELPLLTATLSDLVAYGEISFSGQLPKQGATAEEVDRLMIKLRSLDWLPERHDAMTH